MLVREDLRKKVTDQRLPGVRPVELEAHVQLGFGRAAEHQPLPGGQAELRGVHGELVDLVPCRRRGGGVSQRDLREVLSVLSEAPGPSYPLRPRCTGGTRTSRLRCASGRTRRRRS